MSQSEDDERQADRDTAFVWGSRAGPFSDQPALSRPRSIVNSHGRDPRAADIAVPGGERSTCRRTARRGNSARGKRVNHIEGVRGSKSVSPERTTCGSPNGREPGQPVSGSACKGGRVITAGTLVLTRRDV